MDYGTDFYLIRQLELRDVRLVYAPPQAIGNYGDEIDNFMWPRHTGDFTLLRAYVGKDGKPADYSPDNVPYAPPAHLQVSTRNVKDGDFAMLAGYPGVTFRHRMASEFANQIEWQLPSRVALFDGMIDTIERGRQADATAQGRLRLAGAVAEEQPQARAGRTRRPAPQRRRARAPRRTKPRCSPGSDKQPDAAATRARHRRRAGAAEPTPTAMRDRDQLRRRHPRDDAGAARRAHRAAPGDRTRQARRRSANPVTSCATKR